MERYGPRMPADIRLTVWRTGTYMLASGGADGTWNALQLDDDGGLTSVSVAADGGREIRRWRVGEGGLDATDAVAVRARFALYATGPGSTYDDLARAELDGPWKAGKVIDKDLADGGHLHIERDGDGTGHFWEKGSRSAGTLDGVGSEGRDWLKVWHPFDDARHPGHAQRRDSVEMGTTNSPWGGSSTYRIVKERTRDDTGRERTVWDRSDSAVGGDTFHAAGVKDFDGTRSTTSSVTHADGSGTITTTTTDAQGNGTKHVTSYDSSGATTKDETEDYHEEPHDDEDDEHEPKDTAGAPVGDGTDGAGEGNPDSVLAGFDRIDLRRLLGPGHDGADDLDTLGDLDARLRPWLDRIAGALTAGGGGGGDLLDTLGAPPFEAIPFPVEGPDETEELDSLGRPRPIFLHGALLAATAGVELQGVSAASIAELHAAAEQVAVVGVTLGESLQVVRSG